MHHSIRSTYTIYVCIYILNNALCIHYFYQTHKKHNFVTYLVCKKSICSSFNPLPLLLIFQLPTGKNYDLKALLIREMLHKNVANVK